METPAPGRVVFELRPYQTEIIDRTRAAMARGVRSILIQAPTGAGKTALTARMLGNAAAKQMPSWFTVHRRELVKQSILAFDKAEVPHGVIANNFLEDYRHLVQICSVQTLANRFARLRKPKLIIWDEAHHIAAGSWGKIFAAFPEAFHVGLTATPQRLDGTGLGKWFQVMIEGPTVAWLITNGYLSPYRLFSPPGMNLAGIHTRMGDYVQSELAAVADKPTITGDAITHYQKHARDKRAVVFCVSVEHSKHVTLQFLAAGISAAHVDGETDVQTRDGAIARFQTGEVKVLCNVDLFGEGFDLPAIEAAILLRPTQSLGLYLQQVGRALRPSPGKTAAIILDHAGNVARHGLPDEERIWSLDGKRRKTGDSERSLSVRTCPKCFAAQFPGRLQCSFCGHKFDIEAREVEEVEGDLVEVDKEAIRRQRRQQQGAAQTLEELIAVGQLRNYKNPAAWARHLIAARQRSRGVAA